MIISKWIYFNVNSVAFICCSYYHRFCHFDHRHFTLILNSLEAGRIQMHLTVEICFWFRFGLVAIAIFNRFIILHFELCDQWFRNWCQVLSLEIPLNAFGNPNKTVVQRENCLALTSGDGCRDGEKKSRTLFSIECRSINWLKTWAMWEANTNGCRCRFIYFSIIISTAFFLKAIRFGFIVVFFLFHSIQSGKLLILKTKAKISLKSQPPNGIYIPSTESDNN